MDDLMQPVAWIMEDQFGERLEWAADAHVGWGNKTFALYTEDQMREYAKKAVVAERAKRKPLTDEEIERVFKEHSGYGGDDFISFTRAIEATHGITLD